MTSLDSNAHPTISSHPDDLHSDTPSASLRAQTAFLLSGGDDGATLDPQDEAWFDEWKSKLPLTSTLRLIAVLQPKLMDFCAESGVNDQLQIIEFIRNLTLVGLLPLPHPILIRRYQSDRTGKATLWFTPFIWNTILKRNSAIFFLRDACPTASVKCES